jgi:phosphoribosylanthranilate isomerase
MMVKICGITNLEDALAAAEGGASALGFNFYPGSPRYITLGVAASILQALPPRVWKVGIFVHEPGEKVQAMAGALGLDLVQFYGEQEPPAGIRLWRAVRVGPQFQLSQLKDPRAEAFLLDAASGGLHGGTGKSFNWAVARGAKQKVILAGGLDAGNVRQAIREAQPWGVDACSRLESAPGRKDHLKMLRFIQAALSEAPA